MEWDYGAYEGLTDSGDPGATARLDDLGRRGARGRAGRPMSAVGPTGSSSGRERVDGDTLCVAHGHVLRVLAARWLGLPPVAGRLLLLRTGAVCVLGWELDWPAIALWNRGRAGRRAGEGAAGRTGDGRAVEPRVAGRGRPTRPQTGAATFPRARATMSARL